MLQPSCSINSIIDLLLSCLVQFVRQLWNSLYRNDEETERNGIAATGEKHVLHGQRNCDHLLYRLLYPLQGELNVTLAFLQ
jgi:hypothetical protein